MQKMSLFFFRQLRYFSILFFSIILSAAVYGKYMGYIWDIYYMGVLCTVSDRQKPSSSSPEIGCKSYPNFATLVMLNHPCQKKMRKKLETTGKMRYCFTFFLKPTSLHVGQICHPLPSSLLGWTRVAGTTTNHSLAKFATLSLVPKSSDLPKLRSRFEIHCS